MTELKEIQEWLEREVSDLLDVGSVGLYEFMQLLDDDSIKLGSKERKDTSVQVVKKIIKSGRAKLYEVTWPKGEILAGPFNEHFIDKLGTGFPTVPSEHYLALLP